MGTPEISVIIPVWNVADHVAACLESLAAQSLADFEAIVVDDASTDDSLARARQAVAGDDRFVFVERPVNGGLSAARNSGLDIARGRFLAFVDSDDRVRPDYLERLHATLTESRADWVACAIRFVRPDGTQSTHSAIHGAPSLKDRPGVERFDFRDWREVVRHFPSVWNKLYRRELVAGIRFDEGLDYEDHAFFWRCAARTDHLVHLPEPLYIQTLGRDGQITADGSDKVFEQFEVLARLRDIARASGRPGAEPAHAGMVRRLTWERACVVADRQRRRRFVARARTAARDAGDDAGMAARLGVPAAWDAVLKGAVPISVIVPSNGDAEALEDTLRALAGQQPAEIEIIVVVDDSAPAIDRPAIGRVLGRYPRAGLLAVGMAGDPAGVAAARNRGLEVARGEGVVFLDAGDRLAPGALARWHDRLSHSGADFVFARMRMGNAEQLHAGVHEDFPQLHAGEEGFAPGPAEMVRIHAHPSAKMYSRTFLLRHGLRFDPGPLSSWKFLVAAASKAGRAVFLPGPPAQISTLPARRQLWRAAVPAETLARAVREVAEAAEPPLSPALQGRLFVRAVWEKFNFADFSGPAEKDAFIAAAARELAALLDGAAERPVLDPYVGPRLRRLLGIGD